MKTVEGQQVAVVPCRYGMSVQYHILLVEGANRTTYYLYETGEGSLYFANGPAKSFFSEEDATDFAKKKGLVVVTLS
jgi:hypothetical protein